MQLPKVPKLKHLDRLTPSLYNSARNCMARAAWSAFGAKDTLPQSPRALLGSCFHRVVEQAFRDGLPSGTSERREAARVLFDETARAMYATSHPLLRAKFNIPQRLPYYNQFRERAAAFAVQMQPTERQAGEPHKALAATMRPHVLVEEQLWSRDRLLVGRPDLIRVLEQEVRDYKSGAEPGSAEPPMTEAETRQLRLYVFLANENGIKLRQASISRGSGRTDTMEVQLHEAEQEGRQAREVLHAFNEAVDNGADFEQMAAPKPESCGRCPCIPFCEAFWKKADQGWSQTCGIHVEGEVVRRAETEGRDGCLVSLEVRSLRGTLEASTCHLDPMPASWLEADGVESIRVGDMIRVVQSAISSGDTDVTLRVNRGETFVWKID